MTLRRERVMEWLARVACTTAMLVTVSCAGGEPPDYIAQIHSSRALKDRYFGESAESPIPVERRDTVLPLSYFPVQPDYQVPASLRAAANPPIAEMPTSTGKTRMMEQIGKLEFSLKGQPLQLIAFSEEGSGGNRLFVPFTDLTSGTETYSGGRYIDLDRTPTGIYILDFNRAYHPYCYYNSSYDCPFPPRENRLSIPVRAGERFPPPKR